MATKTNPRRQARRAAVRVLAELQCRPAAVETAEAADLTARLAKAGLR